MADTIHVIGATGRSGQALCRALVERGTAFVPVVRDLDKWRASGLPGEARTADLTDSFALRIALRGAEKIVSCAHARHAEAILQSAPEAKSFVLLGSTRRYTRWLDGHGMGVLSGETTLLASGRPGVMLHPTMIYGAQGENNVRRIAALLRRLPFMPLPGGGAALVQPIHQDDVTLCILAALDKPWEEPRTLVIAGPKPIRIAEAARLPPPRIVSAPAGLLMALAPATMLVPFIPTITPSEIRRLMEDKAFPIGPMFSTLGVRPIPLADGLARIWPPQRGWTE